MSKAGNVEVEYDSDPDEGERLLGMSRRHAASDDEEEDRRGAESEGKRRIDLRGDIHSDDDSDGQGGAADYVEEDEDEDDVYEDGYDGGDGYEGENVERENNMFVNTGDGGKLEGENYQEYGQGEEGEDGGEEEKKPNEPFAVPTAGAFYMHDDRFRDSSGGRSRKTFGERKLWESRDDQRWGHDKFEEIAVQDRHNGQGRRHGRGAYRGRGGKFRNMEHEQNRRARPPKPFDNGDNHYETRRGVKGRGPRKYELMMKNIHQAAPMSGWQPAMASEKANFSSSNVFQSISNAEIRAAPSTKKNSSLSSSSPPFYPSGSSYKDLSTTPKRGSQGGNKYSSALGRGKNVAESVGLDKLHIDETVACEKSFGNVQFSSASSLANISQSSRNQNRGGPGAGSISYQASRMPNPVHSQSLPIVQISNQRSTGGSRTISPSRTGLSITPCEGGDSESNESVKSKNALVSKGKGIPQTTGRGSFMYGGAPGNMGAGPGDQNFPTFLPVMQFGPQHTAGLGVPAVGMAFPGYVAQPQLGLGNSEMTWLPVLTGAAGALGATYCSPYLHVDGTYNTRPTNQNSSLGSSSKEVAVNNLGDEIKPSTRNELGSDDQGQRQKARRYSEMDFKQPSTST